MTNLRERIDSLFEARATRIYLGPKMTLTLTLVFAAAPLHALLVATAFSAIGNQVGGFARGSLTYGLDALEPAAGAVVSLKGCLLPFNVTGSNHRVFVDVKYSL